MNKYWFLKQIEYIYFTTHISCQVVQKFNAILIMGSAITCRFQCSLLTLKIESFYARHSCAWISWICKQVLTLCFLSTHMSCSNIVYIFPGFTIKIYQVASIEITKWLPLCNAILPRIRPFRKKNMRTHRADRQYSAMIGLLYNRPIGG